MPTKVDTRRTYSRAFWLGEVAYRLACDAASAGVHRGGERQRTGTELSGAEGATAGSLGLTGEIIVGLIYTGRLSTVSEGWV